MYRTLVIFIFLFTIIQVMYAQMWEQDNSIFNPSGIPSLTFSQPRFADLDGNGAKDILLGNTNRSPIFIQNTGTASIPAFHIGIDYLANISSLDAEVGVCADMNADGTLDLITGGFTGLHLYLNTGTATSPQFMEAGNYFSGLIVGSNPVPDLADVDHDGDLDMVIGLSESGSVKLYTNIGTPANGQFSEAHVQIIGDVGLYAYPVFCDLDHDEDYDMLVGRDSHGFAYFMNTGTSTVGAWQQNDAVFQGLGMDTYFNSPALADLNNDGKDDLIFGSASGPLNYYVNVGTLSNPVWQVNTTMFGGVIDVGGASSPVFYDFDGDGDLDMISGSNLGTIKYYRNTGTIHAPAWQQDNSYFASIDHSIYAAIAIGDVDGDSLPDAIVGDLNGGLYYHHNTGTGFEQINGLLDFVALGGWSVPRLIDMDGDGDLDIVAGNEAGNLHYYQNQGTPSSPNWSEISGFFGTIDVGSNCSLTLGDIDLDGDIDIVAGNISGDLRCYLRRGISWMENTTLVSSISTDQNAAPALADLDRDGDLDLVVGDYDGTLSFYRNLTYSSNVLNPIQNLTYLVTQDQAILSWNSPAVGSTSPFVHYDILVDGAFLASVSDTTYTMMNLTMGNIYNVLVIAQYIAGPSVPVEITFEVTGIDDHTQMPFTLQNYPNPFHQSTAIRYTIFKQGTTIIEIYNILGQKVKTIQSADNKEGINTVQWNGTDDKGNNVGNGVYFCRLKTGSKVLTRKMLLMK
ncbi:MAG TPA: FG-GAP-like repeat-containing protein [Candidatus Cloacimonadota bacterium]|nr:FG-GAP-like repeat-containing protein [Candidatus Cloacimonadota bacterium]